MTENNESKWRILFPAPRTAARPLDMVALTVALIGGPLIVTVATFYMFVPVFALGMGGPIYLIAGFPAMSIWFARRRVSAEAVAGVAFCVNAGLMVFACTIGVVFGAGEAMGLALFYLIFGSVFAMAWGGVTGWIYVKLCNPIYQSSLQ